MTLALLLSLTGRALGGRSGPLLSMRSSGPRRLLLVVQRSSVPPVEPPVGDGGFPRKQPSRAPRLLIVRSGRLPLAGGNARIHARLSGKPLSRPVHRCAVGRRYVERASNRPPVGQRLLISAAEAVLFHRSARGAVAAGFPDSLTRLR